MKAAPSLVDLETTMRRDPEAMDARLIYADALLERADPRGELILLTKKVADGDASIELTQNVRALERDTQRTLSALLPKNAYVLCRFRHGLVDHIEVITRTKRPVLTVDVLAPLLSRPELAFVRSVELRRCWPRKPEDLLEGLPELFDVGRPKARLLRWLGIGPQGIDSSKLDALFKAFPQLDGLGLFVEDADLGMAAALEHKGLTDFEFGAHEMDDDTLGKIANSEWNLHRLVLFPEVYSLELDELSPFFKRKAMPNLTAFGVMNYDEDFNEEFLKAIVTAPLFRNLTALGFACDSLNDATQDWIEENGERFEHLKLFTAPGYAIYEDDDIVDWDNARDDLGCLFDLLDRDEEAVRIREDLVIADPRSAWYWDNLGDSLRATDRWQEALTAHEKAISLDKSLSNSWQGKADSLYELGHYDKAIVAWDRAIALEDDDAWSLNGRGLTLKALGRYQDALKAFNAAIRHNDDDSDEDMACYARANRAEVMHALGRLDDAYAEFELLSKDRRSYAHFISDGFNWMARVRQLQGDLKTARRLFERSAKALDNPNEAEHPLTNLGRLFVDIGDLEQALATWQRLCNSDVADDYDRTQRGWVLLELGRTKQALAAFEKIEDRSYTIVERALCLDALGKTKEALAVLEEELSGPLVNGCVLAWISGHFIHALLRRRENGLADAQADRSMAIVFGGRDSKTSKTNHDPRSLHATLVKLAIAEGGTVNCEASSCGMESALVGLCAAHVIEDRRKEIAPRSRALAEYLEAHGLACALGRKWELRHAARIAGLSDPQLFTMFRVAEGFAQAKTILMPGSTVTKVTKAKKRAAPTRKRG